MSRVFVSKRDAYSALNPSAEARSREFWTNAHSSGSRSYAERFAGAIKPKRNSSGVSKNSPAALKRSGKIICEANNDRREWFTWGVSMKYRLRKLREYMRGWIGYFGLSEYYRVLPPMDQWIRRRLRQCYWKMWKRPKKRRKELRKLKVSESQINMLNSSRKSYWKLSRTLATNSGMNNAWLKEQGLISLKEQWSNIHYPSSSVAR